MTKDLSCFDSKESLSTCFLLQQLWDNDLVLASRALNTPYITFSQLVTSLEEELTRCIFSAIFSWRESLRNCFLLQQIWDNDVMLAFRPLTTSIIQRDCCLTGSSTASNKVVPCITCDVIKVTVQRRHWHLPCAGGQEFFSIPIWAQFSQASQRKTQKIKYFCPEKISTAHPYFLQNNFTIH